MGEMRDSDWSRVNLLRSDWLPTSVAMITTFVNNIGFESEIYSYLVDIHEHCQDIVYEFLNHRSSIVARP